MGPPAAYTGMIRSAFRPSDDACTYGFLVPANAMAVVELKHTARLVRDTWVGQGGALAKRCEDLAAEVDTAIRSFGIVRRMEPKGEVYAYEVGEAELHPGPRTMMMVVNPGP